MVKPLESKLNAALSEDILSVMNFLNEVKINFPKAISFSAGRPADQFFNFRDRVAKLDLFIREEAAHQKMSEDDYVALLGQYGKTDGIICRHIAAYLKNDEGIEADAAHIITTTGCQEAMAICLIGLFRRETDVLLASDPTYIGITGMARLLGIEIAPVACNDEGLDMDSLESAVAAVKAAGKTPKALYLIPDFNNPVGSFMPPDRRRQLLARAQHHDFLVLEDNPYGMFSFDGPPSPTIKSMDREGRVIYLGTFAKTLFPSLRVGYIVTDGAVRTEDGETTIAAAFSKIKSLTTVNTSPIVQGIVGGILIDCDYSLVEVNREMVAWYKTNRDTMLAALDRAFPPDDPVSAKVSWSRPGGGFFMTVDLPFAFDDEALKTCAREYGVIVVPMSYFALTPGREHQIRLSFSSATPTEIESGIAKLAAFIRDRIQA